MRAARGNTERGRIPSTLQCGSREADRPATALIARRSRAPGAGRRLRQDRLDRAGIDRLRQVMIEARLERAALVVALSPAGDRDEADRLAPWLGADRARDRETVQLRHADVEQ